MTCGKLETLWIPYLDRKLSLQESAVVDAHVAECPECAARRAGLLAVARELDSWEVPGPSPRFDARLRQKIAADSAPRGLTGWLWFPSPSFPVSIAVLLFLAALLIWSGGTRQALPPPQLVDDVRMDELLHVMEEVELLNDFEILGELKKPVQPALEGAGPGKGETRESRRR